MTVNNRITNLVFGAIGDRALHVAIDMQRLFAEPGDWYTPDLDRIAPNVARLAAHQTERAVFTRFMTPRRPEDRSGRWQDYYRRWSAYTTARMDPDRLDLVEGLRGFVPPATVIDKQTHSAFESGGFRQHLADRAADTLIFTGVETDVCMLATVMTAVDRGFRTIVVADAVASSSAQGHDAALAAIYPRFDMQIETVLLEEILSAWS